MTIQDAIEYLEESGLVAMTVMNGTAIYGGTELVQIDDITVVLNSYGIYPEHEKWSILIPSISNYSTYVSSLADAVQVVLASIKPRQSEM